MKKLWDAIGKNILAINNYKNLNTRNRRENIKVNFHG